MDCFFHKFRAFVAFFFKSSFDYISILMRLNMPYTPILGNTFALNKKRELLQAT